MNCLNTRYTYFKFSCINSIIWKNLFLENLEKSFSEEDFCIIKENNNFLIENITIKNS